MTKVRLPYQVDDILVQKLKKAAKAEKRTYTAHLEWIMEKMLAHVKLDEPRLIVGEPEGYVGEGDDDHFIVE